MSASHQDSDELEALFDSIVAETRIQETPPEPAAAAPAPGTPAVHVDASESAIANDVISRIGHLTRSLHDSMRELGYDRVIAKAAEAIPDAQDRLRYVADMTEQAACRTLAATETAQPLQEQLGSEATALSKDWDRLYGNELSVDEFKALASRTREYLQTVPTRTKATNQQLLEIMMAQDFQDLTGQVIKKMMDMTQLVEKQLLELLIEYVPPERREHLDTGDLAGPVIHGRHGSETVTDQRGVDELLESLGF